MRQRVEAARVSRLATADAAGVPHVVPCCFALVGDIAYSAVDAKPKRHYGLRRIANLEANPAASLLVDHYEDEWTALWWVRVDGYGRVVTEPNEHDTAIAALIAKYEQYVSAPPPGPVVALDVTTWRGWAAAGPG